MPVIPLRFPGALKKPYVFCMLGFAGRWLAQLIEHEPGHYQLIELSNLRAWAELLVEAGTFDPLEALGYTNPQRPTMMVKTTQQPGGLVNIEMLDLHRVTITALRSWIGPAVQIVPGCEFPRWVSITECHDYNFPQMSFQTNSAGVFTLQGSWR